MTLHFRTADALLNYMEEVFPQVRAEYHIDHLDEELVVMRLKVAERHLRPGGTVSGPAMFALADCIVYAGVLAHVGTKPLAVTTSCSLDFMRKPQANVDLIAQCRMLKVGKLLAVGDVLIYSDGLKDPVARASITYAIPPR